MVVDWPCAMLAGCALMAITAGLLGVGAGPGVPLPTPPQPARASNAEVKNILSMKAGFVLGMWSHFGNMP
jgi:hypothetical protein